MGCNCKKREPIVIPPQPTPTMVEQPKPETDPFNNLDDYHTEN